MHCVNLGPVHTTHTMSCSDCSEYPHRAVQWSVTARSSSFSLLSGIHWAINRRLLECRWVSAHWWTQRGVCVWTRWCLVVALSPERELRSRSSWDSTVVFYRSSEVFPPIHLCLFSHFKTHVRYNIVYLSLLCFVFCFVFLQSCFHPSAVTCTERIKHFEVGKDIVHITLS